MAHPIPPALSIGAVLGDSDARNLAWKRAISALGKEVVALRSGVESPLRVNVVFHVDGKLAPNEFEGVRTGRFSKQDSHLMVQAAIQTTSDAADRSALLCLLADALDEAEAFARKRGIADHLAELRAILKGLVDE